MYFTDAVRVLLRRWYVLLLGLLLMGGAAAGVVVYVPTNYEASGNVLFLLPPNASGERPVNPYLNVQQGLTMSASIIGGVVSTPSTQRELFRAGFTSDYAVGQTPGTGIPLLVVTAEDTDPQMAVATVKEVIRRIDAELRRMQDEAKAPASQRIMARVFSVTDRAEVLRGAKIRALAVVGAVGSVLTTLAAFALDRSRRTRKERRDAAAAAAAEAAAAEAAAAEAAAGAAVVPEPPETAVVGDLGWPPSGHLSGSDPRADHESLTASRAGSATP